MYEIIPIDQHTWRIEDGDMVRIFLLEGDTAALVVDTGMTLPNTKEIAQTLTKLPLKLINTHADVDHISGNEAFGCFYMHPAEWISYHDIQKKKGTLIPVQDGDVIDLGGRKLQVIELAGHTPGSIALLDPAAKILIGGDSIQDGDIYMFSDHRNLLLYTETLKALWQNYQGMFDVVYPSHGTFPVKPELIPQLIQAAETIISGNAVGSELELYGNKILRYDMGCAGFLCDIGKWNK